MTEYLNDDNKSNRVIVDNISTPTTSSELSTKKKVITTKTSKPTTVLSTPYPAIRGDIDCVLADLSHDRKADQQRVPFPEFGVDIVFRKGKKFLSDKGATQIIRDTFFGTFLTLKCICNPETTSVNAAHNAWHCIYSQSNYLGIIKVHSPLNFFKNEMLV